MKELARKSDAMAPGGEMPSRICQNCQMRSTLPAALPRSTGTNLAAWGSFPHRGLELKVSMNAATGRLAGGAAQRSEADGLSQGGLSPGLPRVTVRTTSP